MEKNPILIVDDEPSYLTLLKGLLQEEGYQNVITEENPANVETILCDNNIDLIITDIYMPQMNGLELLEKVGNSHPQIPRPAARLDNKNGACIPVLHDPC